MQIPGDFINLSTNEKVDGDDDYGKAAASIQLLLCSAETRTFPGGYCVFAILAVVPSLLYILVAFIGKRIFLLNTMSRRPFMGKSYLQRIFLQILCCWLLRSLERTSFWRKRS